VNSARFLAGAGNTGVLVCAAIMTAAVAAYGWRNRGGEHGAWWRTPTGRHLMAFMAAFAWVLDLAAVRLLTGPGPMWFAWLRVMSFVVLIPPVLAWRLLLILRPPRLPPAQHQAPGYGRGLSVFLLACVDRSSSGCSIANRTTGSLLIT
jgi:hypothetical protein